MGSVVSIVHTPAGVERHPLDRYARAPLDAALLVVGQGIVADRKGTSRNRQLNVMSAQTLAQLHTEGFRTAPGEMGEQLVISGIGIDDLPAGTRLRIGEEAEIEVTMPRTGCERFEQIQGQPAAAVAGRLGIMARVVVGGPIRVGDPVALIHAPDDLV